MDKIIDFFNNLPHTKIIHSIIIVIVSFVIYKIIARFCYKK